MYGPADGSSTPRERRRDEPAAAAGGDTRREASPPERDACPLCGTALFALHCKRICRNCGYREDCSDLF